MKNRQVRRSQTLTPFGVGAIIDIEGESFVAADITRWKDRGESINEPRLEKLLNVSRFKMAPAVPDNVWGAAGTNQGVPYFRFPQWLFCTKCRRMEYWTTLLEKEGAPRCRNCSSKTRLTPMRFVMACPNGHLADIPWDRWAHDKKCEKPVLEFRTEAGGSGLEFLSIYCKTCRAKRNLAGIASPDSLMKLKIGCPGRQPWQARTDAKTCEAVPQVLQRGATNLTFAVTSSSIDIPPFSNYATYSSDHLLVTSTPEFQLIKSSPSSPIVPGLIDLLASKINKPSEEVKRIVNVELSSQDIQSGGAIADVVEENDLLFEEFQAFLTPEEDFDPRDRFIKRKVSLGRNVAMVGQVYDTAVNLLTEKIDTLAQVTKLREVRALRGFSRLAPVVGESEDGEEYGTFSVYGENAKKISPRMVPADLWGLEHTEKWLPAIEVFGEGIFLSFSEISLRTWENIPDVVNRSNTLQNRYKHSKSSFLPPPTPRLLFLHTLAHLLIRQLSFECGYSLASLRERIYSSEAATGHTMAGILIYTAAGDSEGTLGGLVRQGEADRIRSTILKALQSAEWCSSDPLCRESKGQGIEAMNLAACHACALLPETSCILSNRMLDRSMLLGTTENPNMGFFSPVMQALLDSMTRVEESV